MKTSFLLQRPALGLALLSALVPVSVLVGCGGGNNSGPRVNSTATPNPSPTATSILPLLPPLQTQLLLLNGQRIALNVAPIGTSNQLTGSIQVFAATQNAKAKSTNGPQKAITRTLQNGTFKLVGTFTAPRDFRIKALFQGVEIFTLTGRFPSEIERGFYTLTLPNGQTEMGFFEKLDPIPNPTATPIPHSTATPRPTSTTQPASDYRFAGDLALSNFSSNTTVDRSALNNFSNFAFGGITSSGLDSAGRTVQDVQAGAATGFPAQQRTYRTFVFYFNSQTTDPAYSGPFFIGQVLKLANVTYPMNLVQETFQNGSSSSQVWSAVSGQATVISLRNGTNDLSAIGFQLSNAHFEPSGPDIARGVGSFDLNGPFSVSGLKRR